MSLYSADLIWKLDELPQFRLNAYDNKDLEVSQSDSSDTEVRVLIK